MPQLGELRTYISAFSILPIMVMIANEVVLTTFLNYFSSIAFFTAFFLIGIYLFLKRIGFIGGLGDNSQILIESGMLILPIIIPMFTIVTTGNPADFVAPDKIAADA